MERLSGKIVFVTGATHGMGRAVADLFAAEGASVVATNVSPPASGEASYVTGSELVIDGGHLAQ